MLFNLIAIPFLVIGFIGIVGGFVYWYNENGIGKCFYHDVLHWHKPDKSKMGFDGCSETSVCKYCDKFILKDGQGNWFEKE